MRAKALLVIAVLVMAGTLLTSACGAANDPTTSSLPGGTSTTVSSSTTSASPATRFRTTTAVSDLRIPWEMRLMPDGRLLVTEREGRIVMADVDTGLVTEVSRIDVSARGEGGLMGLALDPEFPRTPYIYVSYTHSEDGDSRNRVSRIVLTGLDGPTPGLGDETILVDDIPAGSIHNGSRVAFGPDGYLWVTTGDSGDGKLAQQMDSLAGKVLRMTREGQPAPDNPFVNLPYPASLIYTLGHRNPQGLTFHPQTGVAYITEHGPSDNDELNRLEAGGNYGWPNLRGKVDEPGFADPIATWSPTIAPAGALFYSGAAIPELTDNLVFVTLKDSDLRILALNDSGDSPAHVGESILFDEQYGRLRSIAQGPDGSLFVGTSNWDGRGDPQPGDDRILRIEPTR